MVNRENIDIPISTPDAQQDVHNRSFLARSGGKLAMLSAGVASVFAIHAPIADAHTNHIDRSADPALYYPNACGQAAMAAGFSFALQRPVTESWVVKHDPNYFSPTGIFNDNGYAHYVQGAAKEEARALGGVETQVTTLKRGFRDVETGEYAMIMITAGRPGDPITEASHYLETDDTRGNNEVFVHDSHQEPDRHLDKTWRTLSWLESWGTFKNWAVVIKLQNKFLNRIA